MTKKRKRRRPEQIFRLLHEGEAMLVAGKSAAVVCGCWGIEGNLLHGDWSLAIIV